MPGHKSTAVVVVTLQLEERAVAHKLLRIKFARGSLMRKIQICHSPAVTAATICLYDISATFRYCICAINHGGAAG